MTGDRVQALFTVTPMGTSDFVDDKTQQKQKRNETREPSIKTEAIVENITGSGKFYSYIILLTNKLCFMISSEDK